MKMNQTKGSFIKASILQGLFLVVLLLGNNSLLLAQFTAIQTDLRGLRSGGVLWSDFDSDGNLDVFTFGDDTLANIYSSFYTNDSLSFTEFDVGVFPELFDGSIDWADFNNDGHMDLALIGYSSTDESIITKILTYDSAFKELNYEFEGLSRGSIDWGDYNGDGYKDLLMVGQNDESNSITRIFTYDPENDEFIKLETLKVSGASFGDAAWVDFNNDGLLDFIISGYTGITYPESGPPLMQLYKNNGDDFELVFESTFKGLAESSIDWGDADLDGDLDLLVTGFTAEYEPFSGVYINNIDGFVLSEIELPAVLEGFGQWGDMDNDGDLDILIAGNGVVEGRQLKVFENEEMQFTEYFSGEGLSQCSGGWGDFNNDGRLDLFVNGQKEDLGLLATVYVNTAEVDNAGRVLNETTGPETPTNMVGSVVDNSVKLVWEEKNETTHSITYNVKIENQDGLIISPLSLESGERMIADFGNSGSQNFFIANQLQKGSYQWSVQAIDAAYNASGFSNPVSFTIEKELVTGFDSIVDNTPILFPNPSSEKIRLSLERPVDFQIFNLSGLRIMSGNTLNSEIDITNLGRGEYVLQLISPNDRKSIRFIKK